MGRYDNRIKFWNGSSWVSPTRIRIRNADNTDWVDYGDNDSYITRDIKIWNGSSWVRVTRNRVDGDKILRLNRSGAVAYLNPGNQFQYNNLSGNSDFKFYCTVSRDDTSSTRIIAKLNVGGTSGWEVTWEADGRISFRAQYNGTWGTKRYSSNYLNVANTFYELRIDYAVGGTGAIYWGGVTTSISNSSQAEVTTAGTLAIGVWGLSFKNYIRCQGIKYSNIFTDSTFYINNLAVGTNFSPSINGSASGTTLTSSAVDVTQDVTWV